MPEMAYLNCFSAFKRNWRIKCTDEHRKAVYVYDISCGILFLNVLDAEA